jgi:hypothetical protein
MIPGSFPLLLYRGDTCSWRFVLWTDVDKTVPADLAGVTVKAEIRDKAGGTKVVIALACAVEMPNAILVTLDAAASATLPLTGAWDLQLTYPEGEVATVLAGAVSVKADVTDSVVAARMAPTLVRSA